MKHYNPSIIEYINRLLNPKGTFGDTDVQEYIQPVLNVADGRILNISANGSAINAANATIYTTPSDKDFYLVGAELTVIKDVTATSTVTNLNCTIDGVQRNILRIVGLTLTVQSGSISIALPIPIKCDRNTIIQVANSTAVANVTGSAVILGYTVEMTKGT